MKKYVAFLDILGFKNKLKQLGQESAKQYISAFSSTAYHEWRQFDSQCVEGYIVSDSFIIYTKNTSGKALCELLRIIDSICKKEFSENRILIRGAIAKGEFERMPAEELSSLSKGLMVGQAYVDAYTMEDKSKVAGILLSEEVHSDMEELDNPYECTEEKVNGVSTYIMRYLDYPFLSSSDNLAQFISLAVDSNWLPHYYNTLFFAIKGEKNKQKAYDLFDSIIGSLGDPSENGQEIDKFIKNAFDKDVIAAFQKRFLGYIRKKIVEGVVIHPSTYTKHSNIERVHKFIEERGHVTISQISSSLGLSSPTVSRVIKGLQNEGIIESTADTVSAGNGIRRQIPVYSLKESKKTE